MQMQTYLLALGDTARHSSSSTNSPHLLAQRLPRLQLGRIGAVDVVEFRLDGFGAAADLLLLGPALVEGEGVELSEEGGVNVGGEGGELGEVGLVGRGGGGGYVGGGGGGRRGEHGSSLR